MAFLLLSQQLMHIKLFEYNQTKQWTGDFRRNRMYHKQALCMQRVRLELRLETIHCSRQPNTALANCEIAELSYSAPSGSTASSVWIFQSCIHWYFLALTSTSPSASFFFLFSSTMILCLSAWHFWAGAFRRNHLSSCFGGSICFTRFSVGR